MHRIVLIRRMSGNRRATGFKPKSGAKDGNEKSKFTKSQNDESVMKLADIKSLLAAVTKSKVEYAANAAEKKSLADIMARQDREAAEHQHELFQATKTKIAESIKGDCKFLNFIFFNIKSN